MVAALPNPLQLGRQVGESVLCDHCSTVARATHFTARASGAIPKDGVRFSSEIIIVGRSFAPGQALSFGILDHVANYNTGLHPLEETSLEDKSPVSTRHWAS